MRQNACPSCRKVASRAWKVLTKLFKKPMLDSNHTVEYYQMLLRLLYRVNTSERHHRAGFILQGALDHVTCIRGYVNAARELEVEEPITYPKYMHNLFKRIAKLNPVVLTRGDFERYAPYLDEELITELFGEDE